MADIFSKRMRSKIMARIRSARNTSTEERLVKLFRSNRVTGWRRAQKLFGKPDFLFRQARLAVFVDGCFWHGCPKHLRLPASNRVYWIEKLRRNVERDRETTKNLRAAGWTVLRFWEHDLRNPVRTIARTRTAIAKARHKARQSLQSRGRAC
jgi:DNA mismatch endonuclease (patch repair protein)